MKRLIIICLLVASYCAANPRHLWDEEGKILWYKTIALENSICMLDNMIDDLSIYVDNDNKEMINNHLIKMKDLTKNCKNSLGLMGY